MALGGGTIALIILTAAFALTTIALLVWQRRRRQRGRPQDPEAAAASESHGPGEPEIPPRSRAQTDVSRATYARTPKSSLRGSIRRAWETLGIPARTLGGHWHGADTPRSSVIGEDYRYAHLNNPGGSHSALPSPAGNSLRASEPSTVHEELPHTSGVEWPPRERATSLSPITERTETSHLASRPSGDNLMRPLAHEADFGWRRPG